MTSFSKLDPNTKAEVILYVGEEEFNRSYKKRWGSMDLRSSKLSWNWATFFLSSFWATYRKMYAWSYGYLGVMFLIDLVFWGLKHKEPTLLSGLDFLALLYSLSFRIISINKKQ